MPFRLLAVFGLLPSAFGLLPSAFSPRPSAFGVQAQAAQPGITAAPAIARGYDLILNADFDQLNATLPSICPPAPHVACLGLKALSLWWQIQLDPESRALDTEFLAAANTAIAEAERFARAQAGGRLNPDIDPRLLVVSLVGMVMLPYAAGPIWRGIFTSPELGDEAMVKHILALLERGLEVKP